MADDGVLGRRELADGGEVHRDMMPMECPLCRIFARLILQPPTTSHFPCFSLAVVGSALAVVGRVMVSGREEMGICVLYGGVCVGGVAGSS